MEKEKNSKNRTVSFVEETIQNATRDARRSFCCKLIGNIVITIILIAYTIQVWIDYASPSNRQTVVKFHSAQSIEFPAIVFEMTEFGNLESLQINKYAQDCNLGLSTTPTSLETKVLLNPSSSQLNTYDKYWVLVNSSLAYYHYTDYGFNYSAYFSSYNYSYSYGVQNLSRRLLDVNTTAFDYYYNYYYFENYTAKDYYTSPSSNIYILIPPYPKYMVDTNRPSECGDIVELKFITSVPKNAFKKFNLTDPFDISLYVRAFPDSFGIQYGLAGRKRMVESYTNQGRMYYGGKIGFGEMLLEQIQLTIARDRIEHRKTYYYETAATIDLTNSATNATYNNSDNYYFVSSLNIVLDDLLTNYITVRAQSWTDVLSSMGGMFITLSSPILLLVSAWLYGTSLGICELKGQAPLDPLPDDVLKRLDGYIADKIIKGELAPGSLTSQ